MFSFLIKAQSFDGHKFNESLIEWMGTKDIEIQLIEFKSSALWTTKLAELRKKPHQCTIKELAFSHAHCPRNSAVSKELQWLCRRSSDRHTSASKYSRTCSLPLSYSFRVSSEACVQFKVTHYTPKIMELSKGKQAGLTLTGIHIFTCFYLPFAYTGPCWFSLTDMKISISL